MAAAEPGRDLHGHRARGLHSGEIVVVVGLADGEALELARRPVVDVAMDLEQHAPLLERQPRIGVRLLDDDRLTVRADVQELAAIAPGREVDDDVELLACVRERPLDTRVEGGRHDQLLRQRAVPE